jgi:hypothetical protein
LPVCGDENLSLATWNPPTGETNVARYIEEYNTNAVEYISSGNSDLLTKKI